MLHKTSIEAVHLQIATLVPFILYVNFDRYTQLCLKGMFSLVTDLYYHHGTLGYFLGDRSASLEVTTSLLQPSKFSEGLFLMR